MMFAYRYILHQITAKNKPMFLLSDCKLLKSSMKTKMQRYTLRTKYYTTFSIKHEQQKKLE